MNSYGAVVKNFTDYKNDITNDFNYTSFVGDDSITGRSCHRCGEKKSWDNYTVDNSDNTQSRYGSRVIGKRYLSVCLDCIQSLPTSRIVEGKYILYLHPNKSNKVYPMLEKYWNRARYLNLNYGVANDALQYPFHITLTGFFTTDHPDIMVGKIQNILNRVDPRKNKAQGFHYTYPKLFPHQQNHDENQLHYRGIGIRSPQISNFLKELETCFPLLNIKSDIHLTLYHNILTSHLSFYERMVSELLNLSAWSNSWSLVLWRTNDALTQWEIVQEFA